MSLLKIWTNRKQILEGIKNNVFRKEHIELIAKERMDMCNVCEYIDKKGSKCFAPGTQPCCSLCGCALEWKTRSLSSSCGDQHHPKWKALIDEDDENLLKDGHND